jgi:hypothetical protein
MALSGFFATYTGMENQDHILFARLRAMRFLCRIV